MKHAPFWITLGVLVVTACSATPDSERNTSVSTAASDTFVNPIAYNADSIARGQAIYSGWCVDCHDVDGRARSGDVVQNAADLTQPATWNSDGSDGATFLVIRNGYGDDMPEFEPFLSEEQTWHIVNYLKSIRRRP